MTAVSTPAGLVIRNPFTNIFRDYAVTESDADNNLLKSYTYTKRYGHTALRLTASGTHRTYLSGANEGNRWYVFLLAAVMQYFTPLIKVISENTHTCIYELKTVTIFQSNDIGNFKLTNVAFYNYICGLCRDSPAAIHKHCFDIDYFSKNTISLICLMSFWPF